MFEYILRIQHKYLREFNLQSRYQWLKTSYFINFKKISIPRKMVPRRTSAQSSGYI